MDELYHHGILGMRWGVRRYQNVDGSLTAAGRERYGHLSRRDKRWAKRNEKKITSATYKKASGELSNYAKELASKPGAYKSSGKLSTSTINAYNKKMASLMNEKVGNLQSPSGKVVRFVAKRRDVGVYMALADPGYNMDQVKNGIFESGRIAYKKEVLRKG